jgi:hypothetical protein
MFELYLLDRKVVALDFPGILIVKKGALAY